jgi:hypothetical protein
MERTPAVWQETDIVISILTNHCGFEIVCLKNILEVSGRSVKLKGADKALETYSGSHRNCQLFRF